MQESCNYAQFSFKKAHYFYAFKFKFSTFLRHLKDRSWIHTVAAIAWTNMLRDLELEADLQDGLKIAKSCDCVWVWITKSSLSN